VRLREHTHNLVESLLEKSKLGQYTYEEGHRVVWDEARILEIESYSRQRKYNESAHMACLKTPIGQPSLDISLIWIPLLIDGVTKSRDHRDILDFPWYICLIHWADFSNI
jgi:hypothetical protein